MLVISKSLDGHMTWLRRRYKPRSKCSMWVVFDTIKKKRVLGPTNLGACQKYLHDHTQEVK